MLSYIYKLQKNLFVCGDSFLACFNMQFLKVIGLACDLYYANKSLCIWIWVSWIFYPILTSVNLKLTARSLYEIRHCVCIYKITCKRVLAVERHLMKNRSSVPFIVPTLHWAALHLGQVVLHQLNCLFTWILCVMKRHKEKPLEHLTCRSQQMYRASLLPYGSHVLWRVSWKVQIQITLSNINFK